ncbi:hypothetical protein OM076_13625 [Solirubrobacter ginsenosidimutans]|uniref:Uncharacterized protein n=1 Tax=Solirubrobacter ginsenosidimutans TaxID=490573 RepID=A0A9X3S1N3_9ACTN|nr:hypothetical protein [Solirubrobacter ginsenosidimutans]MDA0161312.1 hypothetical protein [Solirubrobacter ginsenosidimutans]
MLEQPERDYILRELTSAMGHANHPRTWLKGRPFDGDFLAILPICDDPPSYAQEAVRLALERGPRRTPPWLVTILQGLAETPETALLIDKINSAPLPAPVDPFACQWLDFGMPFLDRVSLRTSIQSVASTGGRNVLVVNGKTQSGKSYTAEFIDYISRQLEDAAVIPGLPRFGVARVRLEKGYGPTYTAIRLARDVAARMQSSAEPPPGEPGDLHWVEDLASFVLTTAAQSKRVWWWVFDGFADPDLDPSSRRLIEKLADRVSAGSEANVGRVALLDYDDAIPGILRAKIQTEPLGPPASIGEVDVTAYFKTLFDSLGIPPQQVSAAVHDALADLPTDETRLPELAARLEEVTRVFRERT